MAISKDLLIHTVTLKKPSGIDRDRNETYEEYAIANVRVAATVGSVSGGQGDVQNDTAVLYIDAAQSRIANAEIELAKVKIDIGDKIIWKGRAFSVCYILPAYTRADDKVHHWEIGLK